jgi:hypothetical protein
VGVKSVWSVQPGPSVTLDGEAMMAARKSAYWEFVTSVLSMQ